MNSKRKIQLADFNRTVILATANTLFLNRGIEGTTMDEIAHEAGFSKTTLYTYFDSKQDIVDHLILDGMERFHQEVVKIVSRQAPSASFIMSFASRWLLSTTPASSISPALPGK